MKKICYQILVERNIGTEESPEMEQKLYTKTIEYNAENLILAEAEAVPGTIEVSGEFEPGEVTPEERIAQLEDENKNLTAQVDALSFQLDFQEECLVEMANIVYA